MRVLLTGATGLVGRHAALRLAAAGHQVTALARRAGRSTALPPAMRRLSLDLLSGDGLAEAVRGHDAVVHAAGAVRHAAGSPGVRAIHVEGTARLIRAAAAAGVGTFVHVSSLAVHAGVPPPRALSEASPLPDSFPAWMPYAAAKREAERAVSETARGTSIALRVIRPGVVLGAGDTYTTPRMLEALRWRAPVCVGSGANRVPCVAAGDLAAAIVSALELGDGGEQVFLVADPSGPTQADLWRWHAEAAGLPLPRGTIPAPAAFLAAALLEAIAGLARRPAPFHRFDVMVLSRDVRVDADRARRALVWRPRGLYPEAIRSAVLEHGLRGSGRS